MKNLKKTIELEDLRLDFHSHYVIANVNEGVILEDYHVRQILKLCQQHFQQQPYVYISNRKNEYTVNPTIYIYLKKINRYIVGIAVVQEEEAGIKTAFFEKEFSPVPFEIFSNLKEARAWAESTVKEKKAGL